MNKEKKNKKKPVEEASPTSKLFGTSLEEVLALQHVWFAQQSGSCECELIKRGFSGQTFIIFFFILLNADTLKEQYSALEVPIILKVLSDRILQLNGTTSEGTS